MADSEAHQGSCLCGAVRYTVRGPLSPVWGCHCTQCRKTSGHFVAATNADNADFDIEDDGALTWFSSSETAERGFCNKCGSSLFWRQKQGERTSIMAGTLDGATGVSLEGHIFTADKGDYYTIPDSDRQYPAWPERI